MNELIFFLHIGVLVVLTLIALRFGKGMLIGWMGMQCGFANMFVLKQISLFSMQVSSAEPYAVSVIVTLNLIQEFFGKKTAQSAILISLGLLAFSALLPIIHLAYIPSQYDYTQMNLFKTFEHYPQIALVSLLVYAVVQVLDVWVYSAIKEKCPHWSLPVRLFLSLAIVQFFDTSLFSFFALSGRVHSVVQITFMSYMLKMLTAAFMTPFTSLVKKYILTSSLNDTLFPDSSSI